MSRVGAWVATRLVIAAVVGLLVAGCGATPPTGEPATTGGAEPAATGGADPTPLATDRPPAAFLGGAGVAAPGVPGSEGSFTWDGVGSDAPWVVLSQANPTGRGPWGVTFDPPLVPTGWTSRWAPVENGVAGDSVRGVEGTRSTVVIEGPPAPGHWTLQVEAEFGPGRSAAWYWTVDVLP